MNCLDTPPITSSSHEQEARDIASLTAREREVFVLVCQGLTSPEIGRDLFVGVRTVETHRSRILRKLHTTTVADLVRLAIRHRMIEP